MTEIEVEQAIITGLLNHESYRVIGQRIGYRASGVTKRVYLLRQKYSASDRYALEIKLREQLR